MKNEINIMIELQHFWDIVLTAESDKERCQKAINMWETRLKDLTSSFNDISAKIRDIKISLKQRELELDEIDSKIDKNEKRKTQLKSEREMDAVNNELSILSGLKNDVETAILELMEELENSEAKHADYKTELEESDKQIKSDIEGLKDKIKQLINESEAYKIKFNDLVASLSPNTKSRFTKLISSKDGVAIAKVNEDNCGRCNFQIPSSIVLSARNHKTIETCTNCGRFIY